MGKSIGTFVTLLAAIVAAGCGAGGPDAAPDIPAQDPALVAEGGSLYGDHCAECHGADLRGTERGPSHLSIVYEPGHHGDGAFTAAVLIGVRQHHWPFGNMEPVEGLDEGDVAAIVAYVRENQRIHGFEPYPP
jgi:mono/diheme cytochrome c family protein